MEAQMQKLTQICMNEQVKLQERQLMALLEKGDLRQSINSLQSFHKLANIPEQLLPVTEEFGAQLMHRVSQCHDIKEVYQIGQ
jgi:DNA polymerase III delta prime subunit